MTRAHLILAFGTALLLGGHKYEQFPAICGGVSVAGFTAVLAGARKG